jgi:hypothetical protein
MPGVEDVDDPGSLQSEDELDSATLLIPKSDGLHNNWLDECTSSLNGTACKVDELEEDLELPLESDGWQVNTSNIKLRKKVGDHSSFSKRVKNLAKGGGFSREHIEKLLGELSKKPLGGKEHEVDSAAFMDTGLDADRARTHQSLPTSISFSTFLFGASDIANLSDAGSDLQSRICTRDEDLGETLDSIFSVVSPQRTTRRTFSRFSDNSVGSPRRSSETDGGAQNHGTPEKGGRIAALLNPDESPTPAATHSSLNELLSASLESLPQVSSIGHEQLLSKDQQYPVRVTQRSILGIVEEKIIAADGTVSYVKRAMTNPVQISRKYGFSCQR